MTAVSRHCSNCSFALLYQPCKTIPGNARQPFKINHLFIRTMTCRVLSRESRAYDYIILDSVITERPAATVLSNRKYRKA